MSEALSELTVVPSNANIKELLQLSEFMDDMDDARCLSLSQNEQVLKLSVTLKISVKNNRSQGNSTVVDLSNVQQSNIGPKFNMPGLAPQLSVQENALNDSVDFAPAPFSQ